MPNFAIGSCNYPLKVIEYVSDLKVCKKTILKGCKLEKPGFSTIAACLEKCKK